MLHATSSHHLLFLSNVMASGPAIVRRPLFSKSNVELVNGLRANFTVHQSQIPPSTPVRDSYKLWTAQEGDTLYVPTHRPKKLAEERKAYDITVKIFFLPGIPSSRRVQQTQDAINLVLKELGVENIDLLIVSYPGVTFDADDDGEEEISIDENDSLNSDESTSLDAQVKTWQVLETYQRRGVIAQLGVSEFSSDRLDRFLPEIDIKPTVDQINVKDCCVVPQTLITYAKEHNIELLTHNDCVDILPCGTTRELLGPGLDGKGARVLAFSSDAPDAEAGLKGNIEPQWVIKYTAVVKDRGVVEDKGYFACAQLGDYGDGLASTNVEHS